MKIRNKQISYKQIAGPVLCAVLLIILAGFIQSFLATASTPDRTTFTPRPSQRSTPTTATKGTSTASMKKRIAIATPNPANIPTPIPITSSAIPMILGTNLSLKDSSDPVLASAATRSLLQHMHIGLLRMPLRDSASIATVTQAAQIAKNLGMTPLVILQGDQAASNALNNDTHIIQVMNQIFGNSIVYYEYGNEEDLNKQGLPALTAQAYTASWNRLIPPLKKIALNGHFIGPVNYQYNGPYLQYFLQNATPSPNEVSWHEYTCGSQDSTDFCLSHLDRWTTHFNDARARMNTIGTPLPIMITEWNYTANPVSGDGKSDNNTFMTAWTDKALHMLATNGIFAAAQFSCTGYQIPLIDDNNKMTAQGQVFQKFGGG